VNLQITMSNGIEYEAELKEINTIEEALAELMKASHLLVNRRGSKHVINLIQMVSYTELETKLKG